MQGLNILRSLVLGGAMAFGSAISGARKLVDSVPLVSVDRHRGKGQGKSRVRPRSFWYRPTVTSSRKTRNPADPAQAYLIARAEAKRARRAIKAQRNASRAWLLNDAHDARPSLNNIHIAQ